MTFVTPWASLLGGALIGVSASLLLLLNGRVAGIIGIFGGLVTPRPGEVAWRALFVAGLVAGGVLMAVRWPALFGEAPRTLPVIAIAGLLVGFGARLGNGCTSGHGVCGLSRLSPRSLVATLTFMATGMVTVALVRVLGGS